MTCKPSTTAASAAFSTGTSSPAQPLGPRPPRDGQHTLDRTHRAGQRQFARHDKIIQLIGLQLLARGQHPDGDGQIKTRPLLLHVGGGEVDRGRPMGNLKPELVIAVETRSFDSFTAASGNPTMATTVSPQPELTSTSTAKASIPLTAADKTRASIRGQR